MSVLIYPLAFLVGVLFNLNPSCGSATAIWASTARSPRTLALLALTRICVFAAIGAVAAYLGTALRVPWGILMISAAAYVLYTTIRQVRSGMSEVCLLPPRSTLLPWVLAIVPPPSAYIGLALFFGGFNAPSAVEGALTLAAIGLGLTLPIWLIALRPAWRAAWQERLSHNRRFARSQVAFQFAGVVVLTAVGLAFLLLPDFHRPLLELL